MNGHEEGSTRARIQSVALELFVDQGYDKTSLREIAERLGVTKAALYYHFRTKDEIVASAVEDLLAEVDAIVEWGRSQPSGAETRSGVMRRYSEATMRWRTCIRFFQHNPQSETALGVQFKQRVNALHELLVDAGAPLAQRLRALTAIVGLHVAAVAFPEEGCDEVELRAASLEVAEELVNCRGVTHAAPAAAAAPDAGR